MEDFLVEVKAKATEYGMDVSPLSVALAAETYRNIRHYPESFTESRIIRDMQNNINRIAMAAIEIDSKEGAEGEITHSENGITRGYYSGILAFRGVIAYSHT